MGQCLKPLAPYRTPHALEFGEQLHSVLKYMSLFGLILQAYVTFRNFVDRGDHSGIV